MLIHVFNNLLIIELFFIPNTGLIKNNFDKISIRIYADNFTRYMNKTLKVNDNNIFIYTKKLS